MRETFKYLKGTKMMLLPSSVEVSLLRVPVIQVALQIKNQISMLLMRETSLYAGQLHRPNTFSQ